MKKRTGPELEWWVEMWNPNLEQVKGQAGWDFHSIHDEKPEAFRCAQKQREIHGGRWRVAEVAKYTLQVFT